MRPPFRPPLRPQVRPLAGLAAALMFACVPHAPRPTDDLFQGARVVAHRGASGEAPENTMAAFRAAAALGVPFELDVTLSADGEVVVIHDDSLQRTTDGEGFVDETPWSAIAPLDAGAWHSAAFAGERVPRLNDVLAELGGKVLIDIEIKSPRGDRPPDAVAAAVTRLVREAGLQDRVFITSFNPYVLQACRTYAPEIRRGQLVARFDDADLKWIEKVALRNLWLNGKAVPDLIAAEADWLTPRAVRRYRAQGYRVVAWTVNDPAQMRALVEMGVDTLITDHPARALEVLGAAPK